MAAERDPVVAALEAAPDDTERAKLIAALTLEERRQLKAELMYRKWKADSEAACEAERAACNAFTARLEAAGNDAERTVIIGAASADPARGPKFLAEWRWHRTATYDDYLRRYMQLCGVDSGGSDSLT